MLLELVRHVETRHFRHDKIKDDDVRRFRCGESPTFLPIRRFYYFVPFRFEDHLDELGGSPVIVNDQYFRMLFLTYDGKGNFSKSAYQFFLIHRLHEIIDGSHAESKFLLIRY